MPDEIYDRIGGGYAGHRRPDERVKAAIKQALLGMVSVINVGAGSGNYELPGITEAAIEPSSTMIAQRGPDLVPATQASAEAIPFEDNSFDGALAVLTVHHWRDQALGISEMARVAHKRVVILTWDPFGPEFWLTRDYFPEILEIDRSIFPNPEVLKGFLPGAVINKVLIPHDCTDGFLGAFWRRPEAYLEDGVRFAMSTFGKVKNTAPGVEALRSDLKSGEWARRNAEIINLESIDLGYRLVIADLTS